MERRHVLVIAGLVLALAAVGYLAYTLWASPAVNRPTLMYFRADL